MYVAVYCFIMVFMTTVGYFLPKWRKDTAQWPMSGFATAAMVNLVGLNLLIPVPPTNYELKLIHTITAIFWLTLWLLTWYLSKKVPVSVQRK
jgi:hypothetical protein